MKRKKLVALFMAVLMVVSMLPTTVFAEDSVQQPTEQVEQEHQNQDETLVQEQTAPEQNLLTSTEVGITTAEKFESAIATGGEIVLGDDITYETNNAIYIVGKTTIDLNGHTLDIKTGTGTRYSVYIGTSSDSTPELTIKDTSNGDGVLNITNGYTTSKSYLMEVYGTLDIQGGTINLTASKASSYGIDMNSSGVFKMSGGKINKGTSLNSGYTLYAGSGTKIVTGGVIEDYYAGSTISGWEVSGGIFKTQPSYEMMKTGKVTYKIAEGDYVNYFGVTDGTYIGLIGTTMYTSVESFANALGGGKISVEGTKLTLTDDLNLGTGTATKVTFLTSLTLDLAGHDITAEITGPGSSTATVFLFYVNKNDAVVTITDSEGGGMIQNAKEGVTAAISVQTIGANKGTFVIENVTVDATITASNPTNTLFSYPTPVSSLTADGRIILNGATINAVGQTCRSSAIGVSDSGYCEIDNTTINVSTESTGKGIVSKSSSGTLKIGSKNNGKTKINVHGYGNEPTYVATCLSGITNSDDSGASGAVTIANTDVSIVSEIGSGTKPQRCQGIFLGDTSNGMKEIGDNVSVSISGQSAQSSSAPEVHGIRASGGGTINGTNVSVNITHESAIKTYGIYLNGTQDFVINPGTNVFVDVTEAAGTVYKVFAFSSGKIKIADGLYTGGDMAGVIATGGVFDQDPSTSCDLGYVSQANTPSIGLWTVVPDTRTVIKNLTQDEKEYSNISEAIAEAQNHDELQLMTDVLSNAVLNVANINLDLNGYDLAVGELNTIGDVTITDKQATSFANAGTLTGCVNVAAGNVLFTKIKHRTEGTIAPFKVEADTAEAPAKLTLAGVNGEYTGPTMVTSALNNSDITINDNVPGFTTSLKLMNTSTSVCYIFSGASEKENKTTINGGEFEINVNASAQLFQTYAKALVNDGKFKITSTGNANARIANNTNANIDIQGGFFVGTSKDGLVDKAVFFANATKLAKDGKNAIDLETTDPLYAEGYRYTIAAVAIAKNGTTEYTNLQDAIDEASDGDTITLLSNVVYRDFVLDKNLTFEGAYTVTLIGDKPLTLGADLEVPSCFDISSAKLYIEKNNGEKVYYTSWIAYTQPNNTGAIVDYDNATCKQLVLLTNMTVASSLSVYKSCTIDLNGYTIAGNNTTYETLTVRNTDTAVVIKDSSEEQTGKITGSNNNYYTVLVEHDGTSFTLDGGTIENTSEMGAGICAIGDSFNYCENAAIVINGGSIVTGGGFAITDNGQYSRNVDLTINGGEIDAGDGVAIYKPASGTITLNGGTIKGGTGLYVRSGEFIVPEDSTIMIRATGDAGGHGSTTGAAYNTGDAVAIDVSDYPGGNPTADIAGGAFYSENAFAIASYTSSATPAITGFLRGGIYGADTEAIDISNNNLIATGYEAIPNPDEATNIDHPWMIGVAKTYVAKIGDNKYETLAEAIAAVPNNGTTPTTITMLCDVTDAVGISVPSGKNFIVDFANHTYTVNKPGAGSTGTTTQAFQLKAGSTVVFKNGTINVAEDNLTPAPVGKNIKRLIQNYADLTLEDMTLDGTNLYVNDGNTNRAVVETASGDVNIIGSTSIKGKTEGEVSALNVDTWKGAYNGGSKVDINTTGTVDKIYLYSEGTTTAYTKSSLAITGGKFVSVTGDSSNDYTSAIAGGYFKNQVDSKYIAPGYECVNNPDYNVSEKDTKDYQYKVQSKVVIPVDDDPSSGSIEVQIDTESEQKAATVDETKVTGNTEKEVATDIIGKINGTGSSENKSEVVDLTETVGNYLSQINLDKVKEIAKETDTKHSTSKENDLNTLLNHAKEEAKTQNVEVTMNVTTDVDVKVVGVTVEENNKEKVTRFALNITPYYTLTVTSTIEGVAQPETVQIVTEDMKEKLDVTETTTVTFPAPDGFVYTSGMSLFVIHTKESGIKYTYPATYNSATNKISFTNPNGFSEFEVITSSVVDPIAQNVQTEKFYTDLEEALSEAESSDDQTVIILKDLTTANSLKQGTLEVAPNVTLDLNGYDLEAKIVLAWGLVKNNRGSVDGKLIIAKDHFGYFGVNGVKEVAASTENVMPVWDETGETNGYVFYAVNEIKHWALTNNDGDPKYMFQPKSSDIQSILGEGSGVRVYVDFSYDQTDSEGTHHKHLTVEFGRTYLTQFLTKPEELGMFVTLLGTEGVSNITAKSYLKAENCNFSIESAELSLSGKTSSN